MITNPVGRGEVAIARFGLGLEDEVGVLVAGSQRADFPTDIETLLLRVAANQTAIGLQEARRRRDQNRATEELERRVAERTADLRRVNEQLRAENAERKRAEGALRRSEAYLAEAQRISRTGSFGWHVSSGEPFWSDETYRIVGFDRVTRPTVEQVLQRIHPEDVVFVQETLDRASRDGTDLDFEHRFLMPDGSVKYIHVVAHAIRDEKGDLEYVGAVMDVTAPTRSQQALERAFQDMQALKDQHRLVIDTIPGLVWSTLPDGHADFLNQRWLDYTGLSLEEARGWGWRAGFHPEDSAILDGWSASLADGEPFVAEARMRRADGAYGWFLIRSVPLRDELGNIMRWYGMNTDIEDRKQAEDALRRSEAYLAEAQRLSHTGSWAQNILTEEIFWSQEMFRMFGYAPGTQITLEKIAQERVHPEDLFLFLQTVETAIREKKDFEHENRIVLPDGSIRFHHVVAHPVVNESGEVVEINGTTVDVTERKRAEEQLLLTKYSVDHVADYAFWVAPDARLVFVNDASCDALGYTRDELLKLTVHDINPDFPKEAWDDHWRSLRARQSLTLESKLRRKNGQIFPVELSLNYLLYNGQEYDFCFARDITQRKQRDEEMQLLTARLLQLQDESGGESPETSTM